MIIEQEYLTAKQKNRQRLFVLIISRIVIITLLLGITIFIDIQRKRFTIPQITINYFYFIVTAVYLFSAVYVVLFKLKLGLKSHLSIQIAADIILITSLVLMFGDTQIDYSLFYTLIIIYSVIFLGRKGGLIVASVSSFIYCLLLSFEYFKFMPFASLVRYEYNLSAADILTNLFVRVTSFYVLAFLVSFVVEQEKKATTLLEEKESEFNQLDLLFRSIIESVHSGVMTVDLHNVIKTFNSAAEEITGFSRARIQGRRMDDVFPEFLQFLSDEKNDHKNKSRMEITLDLKRKGKINLGLLVSPLKGKHETQIGNILVFQDITQIKKMEKDLEKARNMALIGEMAAGWAHEVRNPLAAITGSIELLKQGMEVDGTNRRLMDIVLRSKDQLESFVRDFLVLSRPVSISGESVDVNGMLEETVERIKLNKNWLHKIKIVKSFSNHIIIFANRQQIRQIIDNLVLNAIQSMEGSGVLMLETSLIASDEASQYAEIKITDTGCGIQEENLDKIFEPFFTNKDKGTGLGLSIVNHIVEGYHGKIMVESTVGKGTTCRVWLPVEREEAIQ